VSASRAVLRKLRGEATRDGAGVRLTRVIGGRTLPDLDPFLLFDEFGSDEAVDYIAGFPDHPHRGFETVTYMLAGRMRHRDSQGNNGLLTPGSVQWMTAGRGLVHSEMPEQENGRMWGFQLWVNLPARDKMTAPRYQDIPPEAIPELSGAGFRVRVLAGAQGAVTGAVQGIATAPLYLDVQLSAGARYEAQVPAGHRAFVYAYEGDALVGETPVMLRRGELAVLGDGEGVSLAAPAGAPAQLVLVAGRPLGEPVARHGPFVMNTREEIMQAFEDFRAGRF
jgi:redox-sensitive bicupin YhaK (pirin superfamily)